MGFFIFLILLAGLWMLWTICRNTSDALDKQTALQFEIVALEKRVEELLTVVKAACPPASSSVDGNKALDVAEKSAKKPRSRSAKTSD